MKIKQTTGAGHFTGGLDLHGMITARAFSYTLLGAGQHDYRKNAITQDTALRTWQDQTLRMSWSPYIADTNANGRLDGDERAVSEPVFGGQVPAPVADSWGSVIDTLGYQITGGFGDWFDSRIGLDAVGIDNEMYASHLAPNNIFEPALEQTHIDGNKGLIYSQLAALIIEDDISYDPEGRIGYIHNPKRVQVPAASRIPNPGLPAQKDMEAIMPCQEALAQNLEGGCDGATFRPGPTPAVSPSPQVGGVGAPTLEFDVLGADDGIWNAGITVETTAANVNGISPAALGNVALDYLDEGQWANIATSRTAEPTNYSQAGKIVTVNDPEEGRWRVRLVSHGQLPTRVRIDFNPQTAEASPGQAAIDASTMDFFSDLNKFVPDDSKLAAVEIANVAADRTFARQFDTLVMVGNVGSRDFLTGQLGLTSEVADAFFANLRYYVEKGGNLVLTDAGIQALGPMGVVPASAIRKDPTDPAGSFNFSIVSGQITYKDPVKWPLAEGIDLPGAAERTAGRRQAAEPVPLGYTPDPALDTDPRMPIWSVLVPAWNAACTETDKRLCTTALVTQNQFNNVAPNPIGKVDLGEIKLGDGRIRIAGEMFPDPIFEPDEFSDHRFGLASYALTYTAYIVFENLVEWANPGRIEPRTPPYLTTLSFTESSPVSGHHTDPVTIQARLLDDLGDPLVDQPLRLELTGANGVLETVDAMTGPDGLASFTLGLDELPGQYGLQISYAGGGNYLPSTADQSFAVLKELTTLALAITNGGDTLLATLAQDDGPRISGRVIMFFANGTQICQGTTKPGGFVTCTIPSRFRTGGVTFTDTFAGDAIYDTSSGQAQS
jgi:hypothetical protein